MGCAFCSGNRVDPSLFLEEMQQRFPSLDFSKFEYISAKTKSTVICNIHGEFYVRPNDLKFDHGCPGCSIDRQLKTKANKGIIRDPSDISEYETYRKNVWKISNKQYRQYKDIINPSGLPRSLTYHLDHKYSIQQGWNNKIPAEVIGGYKNLQMLEGNTNRKKGNKCSILLDEIK